jgi:hypothetical protein
MKPRSSASRAPERDFERAVQLCSAISLGAMAAFFRCLKQTNPTIVFAFTWDVPVAFALGAALSWGFWRVAFARDLRRAAKVAGLIGMSMVMTLAMLASFAGAVNETTAERYREVLTGAALAVAVLAVFGFVLWQIARFLEKDARDHER